LFNISYKLNNAVKAFWYTHIIEIGMVLAIEFSFRVLNKDAGFVYESFRNETNRVIWEIFFPKRIHDTNLRIRKDSDSRISIFKDLFRAIVLRIRKDSLDS
jgi:hypothetical protein